MHISVIEKQMGIETYATHTDGIGGSIRAKTEDFTVEEILADGSIAHVNNSQRISCKDVLGSSNRKTRYLLCNLSKRNWDTLAAIRELARSLGIRIDRIQIAGIKDAKAITSQYITIEDASPDQIEKINIKDIGIRSVGYFHDRLSSYYLFGNSFRIRISALDHSRSWIKEEINKSLEELESIGGIPNFFGHQRFGTTRPITHLVGKAIIKKDIKKAAMLFLTKSTMHEHPAARLARTNLRETHDFHEALKSYPKQLRYERSMLKNLNDEPDDFLGAFRTLPFKLLELFIQAYESYLYNRFLSARIETQISLQSAEVGDFVVANERSGLPLTKVNKAVTSENLEEIRSKMLAGRLRLAIPLVGYRQRCSKGKQGEIEKQILEKEDISPNEFRITLMPEVSAHGGLRAATSSIIDFCIEKIIPNEQNPRRNDVDVAFKLLRGSYATTLLREIMKPKNIIAEGF